MRKQTVGSGNVMMKKSVLEEFNCKYFVALNALEKHPDDELAKAWIADAEEFYSAVFPAYTGKDASALMKEIREVANVLRRSFALEMDKGGNESLQC